MPVNAKGRLKYPDFLSRFSVEKATTPPAPGNSAAAQGGSGAPQTPGEGGSAAPPRTHSPGAGPAPRRQRCVSAPSRGVAQSAHRPGPGQARPGVPAGSERSRRGLSLRCPGKGGWKEEEGGLTARKGVGGLEQRPSTSAVRPCWRRESARPAGEPLCVELCCTQGVGRQRLVPPLHHTAALRGVHTCSASLRPDFKPRPVQLRGPGPGLGLQPGAEMG